MDDRIACMAPVAGLTDLRNYVADGCEAGHCDCMFMVNRYGWDFAQVAALAAPRPLLFCNTDKDGIFPLDGVVRSHAKVAAVYESYKASDKLGLVITEGPHKDTQELRVPVYRWFNRFLRNVDLPVVDPGDAPFTVAELRVLKETPADQKNTTIHETFVPAAPAPAIPSTVGEWESLRSRLLLQLQQKSFGGWPDEPPALNVSSVGGGVVDGLRCEKFEFVSDGGLRLPLYLTHAAQHPRPSLVVLQVLDDAGWADWKKKFGATFAKAAPCEELKNTPPGDMTAERRMLERFDWAFAAVPPRDCGPNQWGPGERRQTNVRRRLVLVGKTLDEGRIWDVRRGVQALRSIERLSSARRWLNGEGEAAGWALYAGLFEPTVERFDLHQLPTTHRVGPNLMNVLQVLDMPQAVALALPRSVFLYDAEPAAWDWTKQAASLFGGDKSPLVFRSTPKADAAP
ncbi:MAG: hypothetical protein ACRDD1_02650 [Planctomycetia bacterium]